MDEYVKQNGFAGWFETSAKENINIEEAARALVNNVSISYLRVYQTKYVKIILFCSFVLQILLNDKMINADEIVDADKFGLATEMRPKKNCAC